jgi:Txe/YoeB family toxin of Txe-Axe toxin-antitoxin module
MSTFSNILATEKWQKVANDFYCESCDYKCSKKYNWIKHLMTLKHQESTNVNNLVAKGQLKAYECENCGKEYSERTGLWRHKQKCTIQQNNNNNNIINGGLTEQLVIELVRQNKELLEIVKNGTTSHSHNTTNSHNKAFNLQFFLNETCKDAMNIGDFVDSLKLQLSDLEKVGEVGYIEGISSIIVKNLKDLDITKRPVHCTDKKRETVYIKDDNKWEKDDDKSKMHKLIKRVVSKNMKMFEKFREVHPDCLKYHSKFSDQYNKIIYESMGGKGDNDDEKNEKIIKNVLKQVVIDKNI